jgi:acetyltransferase
MLVKFHETLSDRSVYMRYLHPMLLNERVAHDRLARICHCDYDREITLIAEDRDPETGEARILGAGRLSKMHGMDEARFSVLVSDLYQGSGVGKELMKRVIEVGRQEKLCRIHADVTVENHSMQHILRQLGFTLSPTGEPQLLNAMLDFC